MKKLKKCICFRLHLGLLLMRNERNIGVSIASKSWEQAKHNCFYLFLSGQQTTIIIVFMINSVMVIIKIMVILIIIIISGSVGIGDMRGMHHNYITHVLHKISPGNNGIHLPHMLLIWSVTCCLGVRKKTYKPKVLRFNINHKLFLLC